MSRPETILAVQVHTLDALFNVLTMRATEHGGHNIHSVDRWLRLAMKAQSLFRATIETLVAIKNPQPTLFAQQANINYWPAAGEQPIRDQFADAGNSIRAEQTFGANP